MNRRFNRLPDFVVWGARSPAAQVAFGPGRLIDIHRFYMGKWVSGLRYLLTGARFVVGLLYDLWTLNEQISELNASGGT